MLWRKFLSRFVLGMVMIWGFAWSGMIARAQIRDGGIDPHNLGKGIWIYSIVDATNKLGGHTVSVTNQNSLMQYFKSVGIRYCIVKAGTSDTLFGDCLAGPQFTTNLVNAAHTNGVMIFGYNRSYGSNIVGEIAIANYIFNQGADGFVYDAESEWESGSSWITNGGSQAWTLCSNVRSNWPTKFIAHAPLPIIYLHATFPYKEFGYWCDAVMPQIYHFSSSGLKNSPSADINWSDVNWSTFQASLATLPNTNINGTVVVWTNSIKPLIPLQDVYGPVISGGIICESANSTVYLDKDVMEFADYSAADPNCQTAGGYQGINFWSSDTIGSNQWSNIQIDNRGVFSNIVNNLVMDDPSATIAGSWNRVRVFGATTTSPTYYGATGSDTNSFGTNYLSKPQGTGAASVSFVPHVVIPGNYDVYQWHPYVTNASAGTPFSIVSANATNVVYANQQTNGGNWSLLGRFNFNTGTNGSITVLDNFSDAGNVAIADGMKLVYATADVILDNTNSQVAYAGSWFLGNSSAGRYQADYQYANTAIGGTATATYTPVFPNSGYYDVYLWYAPGTNRATNAPWLISYQGGSTNVLVNQQINGGGWQMIAAARPFLAGSNGYVQLSNNASPTVVIADGVRFVFAGPLAPVSFQSIASQPDGSIKLVVTSTAGYPLWVDRSSNLMDWQMLTNLVNTNGTAAIQDKSTSGSSELFYRARE